MEIVDYYYKILELKKDASNKEIYESYTAKIEKYRNLPYLNTTQKTEVKELKKAKFILTNDDLRKQYDEVIRIKNEETNKMKEWEKTYAKKEKVNSQLIVDRIFGLATLNMPQKTLDVDRNFISTNKSKEFEINGANADMDNYETI
jgi:DnaJ-class molecular chaperone